MTSAASPAIEREGMHTLVTSAASVVAGFMVSVLIARTLGPAGKGVLDLVTATTGLFSLVLGGSLASGLTHVVARRSGVPTHLATPLLAWCAFAALATGAALLLARDLAVQFGLLPERAEPFWSGYIAAAVLSSLIAGLLRSVLVGRQAMITVNRLELALRIASLIALSALPLLAITGVRTFAMVALAANFALAAAYFATLGRATLAAPGAGRELLRASLPLHGANVLHFVTHRVDVFFVQAQHGAREVGIYSLAVSLAQFLLLASSAFAQPLLPSLSAQTDPADAGRTVARITRLYLVIGVLGAAGLALIMGSVLPLVFGRPFSPSIGPLLILLPGVVAFGVTNILISYFFGQGHAGFNFALSLVGLVLTIVGNLTLTPRYGAIGAAITSTIAYGATAIVAVAGVARYGRLSARDVLWPRTAELQELAGLVLRFRF